MTFDDHDRGFRPDPELRDALRAAEEDPPVAAVDWDALRARIRDRAALALAGRRRRARGERPGRHDRRRRRRLGPVGLPAALAASAVAAAAASVLFIVDGGSPAGSPEPASPAGTVAVTADLVTAEDVLLAEVPDDELRRMVTGEADPTAWLTLALEEDGS